MRSLDDLYGLSDDFGADAVSGDDGYAFILGHDVGRLSTRVSVVMLSGSKIVKVLSSFRLLETQGPHSTPPRVRSKFAQGRLSTCFAPVGMTVFFRRTEVQSWSG